MQITSHKQTAERILFETQYESVGKFINIESVKNEDPLYII